MIFDIQRFSLHDGAGIRTLVFFKGCPLRCRWCSNPESQVFGPEVMYDAEKCQDFGDCTKAAPGSLFRRNGHGITFRRESMNRPEKLRGVCVSEALTICGESVSTEALLEEICKDAPFYGDSGGVTLSGGEPFSQPEELLPLLKALKSQDIRVNVETSLHVKWENVHRCMDWTDHFLVDLKHMDPLKFREFTGGDALLVMENLNRLTAAGAHVILRIPVIPGFNHTLAEIKELLDHAVSLQGITEVHFLPYHALGEKKYRMLGREYPFSDERQVDEQELEPYLAYATSIGMKTIIGG
ncbi:MAG: glycyl-radical enzyme activating protein [Bacteroidales bacterium]